MANIKDKDIHQLKDWNLKELRKLRIMVKNRISALELASKKEVAKSHPLYSLDIDACKKILLNVQRAEKTLLQN